MSSSVAGAEMTTFFAPASTGIVPQLVVPFALWPLATSSMSLGASFAPWQLVTYAFLHGSLLHLAFNMFAQRVSGPVIRMAQLWQDFQQVRIAIERLGDLGADRHRGNDAGAIGRMCS